MIFKMITLKNIKKSYYIASQEYCVLNNINLNISQWEYVSIMGPSGSWKSTLMNIIWLLDTADSGEYILENQRLDDKKESIRGGVRREKIWFIFQNYSLIPRMNVLEQVKLPLIYQWVSNKVATQRANEALNQVWLDGKQQNMPNEISGWQKQRVAIARALVISPKIMLADEPTWALDTKTSDEIMDLFEQLNKDGKTIIIVTHENEIAQRTKRTITVRDGNIINA